MLVAGKGPSDKARSKLQRHRDEIDGIVGVDKAPF